MHLYAVRIQREGPILVTVSSPEVHALGVGAPVVAMFKAGPRLGFLGHVVNGSEVWLREICTVDDLLAVC